MNIIINDTWKTSNLNYINQIDNNLLDYSTWVAGTSGSTTGFNQISTSTINYRELNTDPFGNTNVIWNSITTASGATPRAGYFSDFIDVDVTKIYRSSVWLLRTQTYQTHGVRCFNSSSVVQNVIDISTGSSAPDSFYMTAPNSSDFTQNEWQLHVGFIYPTTWTGTTDSQYTGRYKTDGTKLSLGSSSYARGDLKFTSATTKLFHIVYNIRNNISSEPIGISSQMCYPRIDLVDGTEPSIATLLSNEGMWRKIDSIKLNTSSGWKSAL